MPCSAVHNLDEDAVLLDGRARLHVDGADEVLARLCAELDGFITRYGDNDLGDSKGWYPPDERDDGGR